MPSYHTESVSPQPPGGQVAGQAHHLSSEKYLLAIAYSDTTGDLKIEQSHNGTQWHVIDQTGIQGGQPVRLVSEAACPYARATYENGPQRQNTFQLFTARKGDR